MAFSAFQVIPHSLGDGPVWFSNLHFTLINSVEKHFNASFIFLTRNVLLPVQLQLHRQMQNV